MRNAKIPRLWDAISLRSMDAKSRAYMDARSQEIMERTIPQRDAESEIPKHWMQDPIIVGMHNLQ